MPQEEQSDWPTFEAVLREVAPDIPAVRKRPDGSVPAPEVEPESPVVEPEPDPTELPEMFEPLDIDTSSIRDLLKQRTSESSFGPDEDLSALDPLPEILDLDNPAPGDLVDDSELEPTPAPAPAPAPAIEPVEIPTPVTEADIAQAPPPPILAPKDDDESSTPDIQTEQPKVPSVDLEQADTAEPLNPFDPDFEGLAEELVEDDDDGWITHSMHDIGNIDPPPPSSPAVTDVPIVQPTYEFAEKPEDFDPLARMTSSPPVELPASEPAVDNPFADLLPDDSTPTFDTSGLVEPMAPTEPIETSTTPLDFSDFTGGIIFEEVEEPPAPADQLIDFENFRSPEPAAGNADNSALWNMDHEAEIIPFNPADALPPPPPPQAAPVRDEPTAFDSPSTNNLFHMDDLSTEPDVSSQTTWVGLDSDQTPTTARSTPAAGEHDPWSEIRPDDVPEKISFWENRPKFFGGDDRRKARARREGRPGPRSAGSPVGDTRECPQCGSHCRVDVQDASTGRVHISCDVCRHMWAEDA